MIEFDTECRHLPEPSRATRTIHASSKGSLVGALVAGTGVGRVMVYESGLELKTLLLLTTNPDVVDVWDQPPAVSYVDPSGKERSHTFDFLATMADGSKTAIDVKPYKRAEKIGFASTLRLIGGQLPAGYAHRICLVTERELDPTAVHNAELFHDFREPDLEADQAALSVAAKLVGAAHLDELTAFMGLGPRGLHALIRLIKSRRLLLTRPERITPRTLVKPAEVH
jgi:hypothetical protein